MARKKQTRADYAAAREAAEAMAFRSRQVANGAARAPSAAAAASAAPPPPALADAPPPVQPPATATVLDYTKSMWASILFSTDHSDVTFVCDDGIEVAAHRILLGASSPYFQALFSEPWVEQHKDGRWETDKSSDVIKSVLSLIYIGEAPAELSEADVLLELLETAYEFQLHESLLYVCQEACLANVNDENVKEFLLPAKALGAALLYEGCIDRISNNNLIHISVSWTL